MRATTVMITPRLPGLVSGLLFGLAVAGAGAQPQGPAAAATFRVVRSVSGSRGAVEGTRFVVSDPRTVFNVPGDGQIIVYFEWQGPAGRHRMEGIWRDPSGKVATITNFDYEARATSRSSRLARGRSATMSMRSPASAAGRVG